MGVTLLTQHCQPTFIPLSLLYLKAALVSRASLSPDAVHVVEADPQTSLDAIVERVSATAPDVLGLSCYVWNVKALLEAARRIKMRRPSVKIVAGGPEVGPIAPDVLRRNPHIDVIVRSEGEVPLAELAAAWTAGMEISSVRGITFVREGEVIETPDAPLVKDLDDYASPHLAGYGDYPGRTICLETQRGCVFRCSFCFYNKDYSLRNRRFDLDRVKQELLHWLQRDIARIYLMDPVFNLNAARAKEICAFIAKHNTRGVPIHSEIWAEFVDDEMAALMKAAGFTFLEVGLQTTDTTALATVDRRLKMQRFLEGIAHLKRHGLHYQVQLIYGLPGETRQSFIRSLNFAMALDPPELSVFELLVLPGTELWRKADAMQLEFDPEPPYTARSHRSMSRDDFAFGRAMVAASNLLQSSRTIRLMSREPGVSFADLADDWIAWSAPPGADRSEGERMCAFVADTCDRRALPRDFYIRFVEAEYGRVGNVV